MIPEGETHPQDAPTAAAPEPGAAPETAPPLLGPDAEFEGLLSFRGTARIEGRLRGEVLAQGRLEVGPDASVQADVQVDELVVDGRLEGTLHARGRAELRAGARVRGSLRTPRLRLLDGGRLDGRCQAGVQDDPDPAAAI